MQPTQQTVIPFNFFAGALPTVKTNLAWVQGYDFIIASIVLSTESDQSYAWLQIIDAEENYRFQAGVTGAGTPEPLTEVWRPMMVMGPSEGAQVVGTGTGGVISIDGYALAPIGSSIW